MNQRIKPSLWIMVCVLLCVFLSSTFLFYNQALGNVHSDLPAHLQGAISGNGYSITTVLLWISYHIAGRLGCALLLSFVIIITIICTAKLFQTIVSLSEANYSLAFYKALWIAIPFCFLGSIYIPHFYPIFYLDPNYTGLGGRFSFVTQPWHNSTYLVMRLFGILAINEYFKIESKYLDSGISLRQWLFFFISMVLVNAAKPNFVIAFAPAMFIVMVVSLFRRRGKGFTRMLQFGSAVLCSMPILLFQSQLLFPNTGNNTEAAGVILSLSTIKKILQGNYLFFCLISGLLFPIIVSGYCLMKKESNRILGFSWLMFIISFLESILLKETGSRENHGNFGWGNFFFSFILVAVCVERMISLKKQERIKTIPFMLIMSIFIMMVISGLAYFVFQFQKGTYLL